MCFTHQLVFEAAIAFEEVAYVFLIFLDVGAT